MERWQAEAKVTIGEVARILDLAAAQDVRRDEPPAPSWDEAIARVRAAVARDLGAIGGDAARASRAA